jgi:hypothetical protein
MKLFLYKPLASAATNAQRGFKGVIQSLGKVLTAFSKSLA